MRIHRIFPAAAVALAACLGPITGCDRGGTDEPDAEVVVYCSVDTAFAEPILADYERLTGVKVHQIFDTEAGKTTGLVSKLKAEKGRPRADVWWSSEIFGTMELASGGVLAAYEPAGIDDIPRQYRDSSHLWTAVGLRGRVIAYDPKRTRPDELPRRWCDLVEPKYAGQFRMADPRFGTTRGHMAVLLSLWGEEAMRGFYRGLRNNGCKLTDGNSQSVVLLSRGVANLVATDTDDVIVAQGRGDSVAMIYPDMDAPGGGRSVSGTLWIPCSVALVSGAPRAEAGRKLVDFLVSAEIEVRLHASESRNVPVRPGLRARLGAESPGEAAVDYSAAAGLLDLSDRLVRDILLE